MFRTPTESDNSKIMDDQTSISIKPKDRRIRWAVSSNWSVNSAKVFSEDGSTASWIFWKRDNKSKVYANDSKNESIVDNVLTSSADCEQKCNVDESLQQGTKIAFNAAETDAYSQHGIEENKHPPAPMLKTLVKTKSYRHPRLAIIESKATQILFMIPLMVVSIFLYDSWIIANPPDNENGAMNGTLIAIALIFFIEIMYYFYYEGSYRFSCFILLDIAATASLLLDLTWVDQGISSSTHYLGEARAAKLFARYGRIMRLIKLGGFVSLDMFKGHDDGGVKKDPVFVSNMSMKSMTSESNHSAGVYAVEKSSYDLSRWLTVRVSVVVAALACIAPYLTYRPRDLSVDAWMTNFQYTASSTLNLTTNDFQIMANDMHSFYANKDIQLLYIYVTGPNIALATPFTASYSSSRNVVRSANMGSYDLSYYSGNIQYEIKATMDETYPAQMESVYFISLALLVILLMFLFTISFHLLLNKYLVVPLNKVILSLKESARQIMKNVRMMSRHFGNLDEEEEDDENDYDSNENESVHELTPAEMDEPPGSSVKSSHSVFNRSLQSLSSSLTMSLYKSKQRLIHKSSSGDSSSKDEFKEFQLRRDDEVDVAVKMTKMVEKLAKLVKNMLPNGGNIEFDNSNIDLATKTWLHANYMHSTRRKSMAIKKVTSMDFEAERIRLQKLAESQTAVSPELLNSWDFDVLNYSNQQLCEVLTYLFSAHNFFVDFSVPDGSFSAFIMQLCELYNEGNKYHNFKHGCDVCHTTHRYLTLTHMSSGGFSRLEVFSVLVAALSHDVGHPGVNNIFLVKAKDELALRHNDNSPLENMHCSLVYEILSKPASNIFAGLTETQWRESRKVILTTILGTDIIHHFDQINRAHVFYEVNGKDINSFCRGELGTADCLAEDSNRLFLLELLLHLADISNPTKPWAICEKWSTQVAEEFARQGDREKAEGLEVSPMMDRSKIVLCNMQLGFIEFVVTPLAITMINIFPALFEIGLYMKKNYVTWCERRKQEIMTMVMDAEAKLEECNKLDERATKYGEKLSFVENFEIITEERDHAGMMKIIVKKKGNRGSFSNYKSTKNMLGSDKPSPKVGNETPGSPRGRRGSSKSLHSGDFNI